MNNKLKNCISLRSHVKIYVPSTIKISIASENRAWVDKALCELSACFNGATSYEALGAWITQAGSLIKERVTLCESYCTESDLEKSIDRIYDFCLEMKRELEQEMIALEVNGVMHFI